MSMNDRHVRKPDDNFYVGLDCNGLGLESFRAQASRHARDLDGFTGSLKHRSEFHITVVDPKELKRLQDKHPELLTRDFPISKEGLQVLGIGRAAGDSGKVAYFLVVDWPEAQDWRAEFGLAPKDFHITLGFIKSDVFGVPKDASTLLESKLGF